jgi:hypothetical protein
VDLIHIGYWLSESAPGCPDVHDFVDPEWDAQEREAVAAWLRTGENFFAQQMGFSRCRFCGIRNGSLELTDSMYLWPEGLVHHVDDHAVRLPSRIVKHASLRLPVDHQKLAALEAAFERQPRLSAPTLPITNVWWNRQRPDWLAGDPTEPT